MSQQIQSFKAGDLQPKRPLAGKAQPQPEAQAQQSGGFPRVEALIDEYATAAQAKEVFADSIARLEGMLAGEKNPKKKGDLVKAKRAFEHTMSTLDYLFQVKTELAQAAQVQAVQPPKGKKK